MEQVSGRIDRLNTPFVDLYYYHMRSESKIDNAIRMRLRKNLMSVILRLNSQNKCILHVYLLNLLIKKKL